MKRFLSLIITASLFISCQEDVKFNNPGFQGLKDDVFWRANDARANLTTNGGITIQAYTEYEILTLNTSLTAIGKYSLGSSNINNSASFASSIDNVNLEYATIPVPGPVSSITLVNSGTGYVSNTSVATTGGTGSGLSVATTVNASGNVTNVTLVSRGNGYMAGDLITVTGGNLNCKFRVLNVQNSNGEIEITDFDSLNMTVTGKFKFNAANVNNNPAGGQTLNFQYGAFYKVPIYPSN